MNCGWGVGGEMTEIPMNFEMCTVIGITTVSDDFI